MLSKFFYFEKIYAIKKAAFSLPRSSLFYNVKPISLERYQKHQKSAFFSTSLLHASRLPDGRDGIFSSVPEHYYFFTHTHIALLYLIFFSCGGTSE